jgi:hypothetical protein
MIQALAFRSRLELVAVRRLPSRMIEWRDVPPDESACRHCDTTELRCPLPSVSARRACRRAFQTSSQRDPDTREPDPTTTFLAKPVRASNSFQHSTLW